MSDGKSAALPRIASSLALLGVLATGCATAQGAEGVRSAEPAPNLSDLKKSIVDYHDSGRWDADIARADRRGQDYLARRLAQGVSKPAIVLDIDETSLSTYGYETEHDFGYDKAEYDEYVLAREATGIAATRDLVRFADAHGVAVFFVTGRRESPRMRDASTQDLREEGYPEFDGLYLRPVYDHDPSVVPYKSGARADIERQGYRIILNIGDQDSDLAGGHAERGVKLPNPMYKVN
ncbi:HAD family acid phosphatase [Saccharopolyspora phatthalungensis]|uniref:5'-nucleotidase (Lipoprotein e(P4) family) n=1 Tax=Saccharopolyspora phatthalungensis TaxID=664693 RepID=A0A840Q898_9PSEU|nr:HAD family acid phosphatase [Saccharopolyspora phatthalungensis]MBB5154918.1 5'-nucleotidase (lipoprotein e(P4) family) [Saccharopolyspora phatthalungensis]